MDARRLALVLVVLAGLALAGCTIASQESEYPEEDEVREKLVSLDSLEADVITETRTGNETTTIRVHMVQDIEHGRFRSTYQSGENEGLTIVMDGEQLYYYEPHRNVVQVIDDPPDPGNVNRTVDTVSAIYERLNDEGNGDGEIGISPAPTVPAGSQGPTAEEVTLPAGDNVSVTHAGTDTVDGREVRVVELESTDPRGLLRNATYYIDTEWHVPLQTRIEVTVGDRTSVTTQTYTNVSFETSVDDETFEFEPPSTATVVEGPDGSFEQYQSRESLTDAVEHSIPDPSLPERFEFRAAEVTPSGSGQSITMIYADRSETVTVTKLVGSESDLAEDAESIEVAGQPGRRTDVGPNVAVAWTCPNTTYSVVGPEDGLSVIEVAESVGCS